MTIQNSIRRYTILAILIITPVVSATPLLFADPLKAGDLVQAYKTEEKTCRQMERDHENMKGRHKLMFKAWQEKSQPILTEDEGLIASCQEAVLILKLKDTDKQTDPMVEPMVEYDKALNTIKTIVPKHKALKERHEDLFHSMMGH